MQDKEYMFVLDNVGPLPMLRAILMFTEKKKKTFILPLGL